MYGFPRGDLESVESYIATGGDLERMDWDNCTALHIACAGAFSQVAQLVSNLAYFLLLLLLLLLLLFLFSFFVLCFFSLLLFSVSVFVLFVEVCVLSCV